MLRSIPFITGIAAMVLSLTLGSRPAAAEERQVEYTEKIIPFADWGRFPQERQALSLFKNYTEPTVFFAENGVKKNRVAHLTMYVTRSRISIAKQVGQIRPADLIKIESLRKLDSEIAQQPVGADQIMPKIAGHGPINNFKWCQRNNDGQTYISLPNYEQDLSYLSGSRPWCQNDGRTTCVESCYLFQDSWQQAVMAYNLAKKLVSSDPADLKDYGIAMQAEARYYTSEAEYGQNLRDLTQVSTPVKGIIELNIFYVNQVMQYGKVVAVFQEHPSSPQATVVTTLSAIAIRTHTWAKHSVIRDVLQGKSTFNTKTGITAGIPVFTKNIALSLANILEQQ